MSSESEEDYYDYSDDEEDQEDDLDAEYGFDDTNIDDDELTRPKQAHFVVLNNEAIIKRQAEAVNDVATVLSIDPSYAALLLRHFKWSVSQVNDEWFQDEERVRSVVGLPGVSQRTDRQAQTQVQAQGKGRDAKMTCGICFDSHSVKRMQPASCQQHFFCDSCWRGYTTTAVAEGPGCLSLRCPEPSCSTVVSESLILHTLPDSHRAKYNKYKLRSFVDDNRNAKWCPAPGCEFAVEFLPDSTLYDITCKCGHNFCWNCLEEAHRPVDCDTVAKWILKNSAESENMNWILANSKSCPKCKRPIEKNQGCMHMTCTPPCKYEFCWLCLGAWSDHGEKTGGFYACNRYQTAKEEGMYNETERRREMAKNSLEKYTHYYERWAANEQSRAKAIESLREMQETKIEILSERQSQPASQLKFVIEAWMQIVECRRVLKWTYSYGYYLPESEVGKRQFFEYLQGEADSALENLHKMAEKELEAYIDQPLLVAEASSSAAVAVGRVGSGSTNSSSSNSNKGKAMATAPPDLAGDDVFVPRLPFNEFRSRLAGLTSVTHTYFENLVRALETGLEDVKSMDTPSVRPTAMGAAAAAAEAAASARASSRSQARAGKVTSSRSRAPTSGQGGTTSRSFFGGGTSSNNRGSLPSCTPSGHNSRDDQDLSHWSCEHCTFANTGSSRSCAMCHLPHPH